MLSCLFLVIIFIIIMIKLGKTFEVSQVQIKSLSLFTSIFCFFCSILMWILFDRSYVGFQSVISLNNSFTRDCFDTLMLDFNIEFGIDGISMVFILLTAFLIILCILSSYAENIFLSPLYCWYFFILELNLVLVFTTTDVLLFFIFFESLLLPMLFIIGIWGSKAKKIKAIVWLVLYTLAGSIFLLFAILILYAEFGSTHISTLSKCELSFDYENILFILIYIAFAVKIPIIPFHIWLLEAHVQSPTAGSVVLAGLLLKSGGYAYIRISVLLFKNAIIYLISIIDLISIVSVIVASIATIRQIDFKRLIAYSSVAHMNVAVLGVFSCNIQGICGSIFIMFSHGVVSAGLFLCVGFLYDRYKTRLLLYYGGLNKVMPLFSYYFFICCLANMGVPVTSSFVGELLVFISLSEKNLIVLFLVILSVVGSVLYTTQLFNQLMFGTLNNNFAMWYLEISRLEQALLLPLVISMIVFGIFPSLIIDVMLSSAYQILEKVN